MARRVVDLTVDPPRVERRGWDGLRGLRLRAATRAAWMVDGVTERRGGVATADSSALDSRVFDPNAFDVDAALEDRLGHRASDWLAVRRVLQRLHVRPDDVLVDFGSGLGRVVLASAELPFRKVIGVEISEELVARSRENLASWRGRLLAGHAEVVHADALDFEIPDDLTVAYLFCPFDREIFDDVFRRLLESVERHPRVLRMVYNFPRDHPRVIESGRAELLDVAPGHWPPRPELAKDVILTYLLLPEDGYARMPADAPRPHRSVKRHPEWLGPYDPGFSVPELAARR